MEFRLVHQQGHETITVFFPDGEAKTATDTHPGFAQAKQLLLNNPNADHEEVRDLLDLSGAVQKHFEKVSDRVSIRGGQIFLDYEPVDTALTQQILRFHEAGLDFTPLVSFFEKIQSNPQEHSREQLYSWLARRDFTITQDGDFIAYKSVKRDDEHGYVSSHHGNAIVNGTPHDAGPVPNPIGGVIELPRHEVDFDPAVGCSSGLHAGTYHYATNEFRQEVVLKVRINPRDVVSVPTDSHEQKLRVCRYTVVEETEELYTAPLYEEPELWDDVDEHCTSCGEFIGAEHEVGVGVGVGEDLCDDCFYYSDADDEVDDTEFTDDAKLRNEPEDDDFWTDQEKQVGSGGGGGVVEAPTVEELREPDQKVNYIAGTQVTVLRALGWADGGGEFTLKEVAEAASISRDAAKNAVHRLIEKGLARPTGEKRKFAKTYTTTSKGLALLKEI